MFALATTIILTSILLNHPSEFKPERFVATADLHFNDAATTIFKMFEPLGEKQWAKGWEPVPVYPQDIPPAEGTVFVTHSKAEQSIWTITRYEAGKFIEYNVITPSHDATQVLVACHRINDHSSKVTVTYRITGLSESGNQFGRKHALHFTAIMDHWQETISEALKRH
jgi:hypothetical protein